MHAGDLTLDAFIDAATPTAAPTRRRDAGGPADRGDRFVERYPALECLRWIELVDGTLICLVRATSN